MSALYNALGGRVLFARRRVARVLESPGPSIRSGRRGPGHRRQQVASLSWRGLVRRRSQLEPPCARDNDDRARRVSKPAVVRMAASARA
jgi:hypothetical protein